jgi:hypothetical protein
MPFESDTREAAQGRREGPALDRKLGDEWEDWDGTPEGEIDEPGWRFLLLATFVLVSIGIMVAFGFYLIRPRMEQWPGALQAALTGLVIALLAAGGLLYAVILLEVLTGKVSVLPYRWGERMLLWLLPKAVWVGTKLGLSRDQVSNSFIKVNNTLIQSHRKRIDRNKLLILLPRCLNKATRQEIRELLQGQPHGVFTVGGGEEARKVIRQQRPTFIIALACERDLISGIRDVAMHIPVIGIPNKRPEGPCKNTYVDMTEFRRALRLFDEAESPSPDHSVPCS